MKCQKLALIGGVVVVRSLHGGHASGGGGEVGEDAGKSLNCHDVKDVWRWMGRWNGKKVDEQSDKRKRRRRRREKEKYTRGDEGVRVVSHEPRHFLA